MAVAPHKHIPVMYCVSQTLWNRVWQWLVSECMSVAPHQAHIFGVLMDTTLQPKILAVLRTTHP
jgi:hypothetical protein